MRRTLWRTAAVLSLLLLLSSGIGCGTRTIYVKDGDIIRLRQRVKRVEVWVKDSKGVWSPSSMDLEEGWYTGIGNLKGEAGP